MSVIRKKPFIQELIDDLSGDEKIALLEALDENSAVVNTSLSNMPVTTVTPVLFQFDANNSKTGILIQSDNYRVLICYHRFQDLLMIKFDSHNNYEKVNEYLDINELRRILCQPKVFYTKKIKELSDDILNALKPGDMVIKMTGKQMHTYIVTYKEEKHGICISYFAAGYSETQSYDYTDGHWVYNSEDVSA